MTALLSLGSNLGDRLAHLSAGLDVIGQQLAVLRTSPIYQTAPVGVADQPPYLNLVALVDTDDPEEAWTAARGAEQARGRLRTTRWGSRTLDVDVVVVDAVTSADPRLTLPHPRAHQRAFVLRPWLDLDPDASLPGHGPVRALLAALPDADVQRYAGPVRR